MILHAYNYLKIVSNIFNLLITNVNAKLNSYYEIIQISKAHFL